MIPGSVGRETEIMAYMVEVADTGVWFPGVNDCFNKVDNVINYFGLEHPGFAAGRLGNIPQQQNNSGNQGNYKGSYK